MLRRNQKGFTLMELMVVIVIVAILAAVAVPLYINYVKDAQRTEAKGAVGAVVTAEQTYFQQHQAYTADNFVKNPGNNPGAQNLNCDLTDALQNWSISVAIGTGGATDGFVVTATGITQPTNNLVVVYTYSRTSPPTDAWAGTK